MPITVGTTVTSNFVSPTFSSGAFRTTFNVTVASGQNMLTVRITGTTRAPSSITFNGVALTQRVVNGDFNARVWDLLNPDVGTFALEVAASGGELFGVIATPLAGVDATTPRRTTGTSGAVTGTSTITLTTVADDLVLDCLTSNGTSLTAAGGQTDQFNVVNGNSGTGRVAASSRFATGTSTSMTWTVSPSSGTGGAAVVYIPSSGGSSTAFDDTAFNTDAFSADAFDLGASGPAAPSAGGYRLRRAPRGGQ